MSEFNISIPGGQSKRLLTGGKYVPEDILVTAEGRVPVAEKEVNFYDYDGTCLYAYTIEEAQALTELPPLPTQPGLVCQGWNWSLDMIQKHPISLSVGAIYITDNGATRFVFSFLTTPTASPTIYFRQSKDRGVKIDWGDGSPFETVSGTGLVSVSHQYPLGEYTASFLPDDDCNLLFSEDTGGGGQNFIGVKVNENYRRSKTSTVKKIHIGKNVTSLSAACFNSLVCLDAVTIPNGVDAIGWNAFDTCLSLRFVVIPSSLRLIYPSAFNDCRALVNAVFSGRQLTYRPDDQFPNSNSLRRALNIGPNEANRYGRNLYALNEIVFWDNVTTINNGGFNVPDNSLVDVYILSPAPPVLTSVFPTLDSESKIYVRKGTLSAYEQATNWTALVDYMEELAW